MLYIRDPNTNDLSVVANTLSSILHIYPLVQKEDSERPGGVFYAGSVLGFEIDLQMVDDDKLAAAYSFDLQINVPISHHARLVCMACVHETVAIALVYAGLEVAQCFYDDSEGKHLPVMVRYSAIHPPDSYRKVVGTPVPPYEKVHRW